MTDRREATAGREVWGSESQRLAHGKWLASHQLLMLGRYGLSPNPANIRTSSLFQNPSARAACHTKFHSASKSIWIPSARAASSPPPSLTANQRALNPVRQGHARVVPQVLEDAQRL